MKPIHIIIIIALVAVIAVVVTTLSDTGTYSNFEESASRPGKEFHIIGTLNENKPVEYNAQIDPNRFSFYMIDENGVEKKVIYNKPRPQDFEKSEKVVIIGSMKGDEFHATSLLLKCPSKYNSENKPEKFGTKEY